MIQNIFKQNYHLDPRIKFILIIIIGFFMFYFTEVNYMIFILALFIFLSIVEGIFKKSLKFFMIFSIIILVDLLSGFVANIWLNVALSTILFIAERFAVFGVIGAYVLRTTKLSECIIALESFKIPQTVVLPFSVMFRFLPTILEEYNYLKDSMKIRGISSSFAMIVKKPFDYMEYFIVPMLIRSFKISDELSAYAMLRGLDNVKNKTVLFNLKLTGFDYLITSVVLIFTFIFLY